MTALKRTSLLMVCGSVLLFTFSCGGGAPPIPAKPLIITSTSLSAAVINVPYSATLTLIGGVGPYTWALASGSLPAGLSLSTDGKITGTPTTLGSTTFKVQVTDSQTPKQAVATSSETIAVNSPLAISSTSPLTPGSVGVPYSTGLQATGGVPPYTWTLTSGVLPAGLSLASSGSITGTPTNLETQTFTVQVADSQSPATTASATLSLTIAGPTGRLNGNYVFSFSGFHNGQPIVQAGSFTADGAGNITNGLLDSNSIGSALPLLKFTGTYSVGATNTGPMTLNITTLGTFTYQIAVPASGAIRFIQNGQAGGQGTGVIRKVLSPSKLTLANLAAFWSYGATGADAASARYATVGTFQADNKGGWSNLESDANDNGSFTHDTSSTGQFAFIDPVTQRGTAIKTVNGVTTNYAFYPISANELFMVSLVPVSSAAPLALFTLQTRSSNSFTNALLKFATVTELQGVGSSNGSSAAYGLLAIATFDGNGGVTVSTDENLGGTLSANKYTATYNVASNGRTTITGFGANPVVFYIGGNAAFALEGDTNVSAGTILIQQGSSFSNSSINGSYQGGTLEAVLPSVTVEDDSAAADGNGNIALTYDTSGPGGPQQGLTQAITYSVDSAGRAPLQVNGNTVGIAYVVGAASGTGPAGGGKVLVLSTDTNANINALEK
jgi:hypothetical protein